MDLVLASSWSAMRLPHGPQTGGPAMSWERGLQMVNAEPFDGIGRGTLGKYLQGVPVGCLPCPTPASGQDFCDARLCPRVGSLQQSHQIGLLLLHLIERALPRRLVGAPAQQPGAVAEALAAEVIVADLDHELRLERLPFGRALRRPAAGPAGGVAGEARRRNELFQSCR